MAGDVLSSDDENPVAVCAGMAEGGDARSWEIGAAPAESERRKHRVV